ncbi:MAG: late competence development ComFB family protein [Leptolyngbyaceae cyanobacterium CRU_2_3]|nr:late competence development ComFB family protein [Leptolyngbyaceae cyanobacterium CRU_2_3]
MVTYKNVMELLVEAEVSRQVKALPTQIASYIHQAELVAYALNQLPALYATSEKGLDYQLERGKTKYAAQVAQSVQRAIAAVHRDPLRSYAPLKSQKNIPFREVLQQMRGLLRNDCVDWENLPLAVEQALTQAAQGEVSWDSRYAQMPFQPSPILDKSSPFPQQPSTHSPVSAHSAYRQRVRPEKVKQKEKDSNEIFGWDDPLYNPQFPG